KTNEFNLKIIKYMKIKSKLYTTKIYCTLRRKCPSTGDNLLCVTNSVSSLYAYLHRLYSYISYNTSVYHGIHYYCMKSIDTNGINM
ncbi:unnamed protein product, partial [Sphagnum compactum]